jgi:carbonic anhydrase/acetyltransferase-like protein (isoleucine patch superfamily)
MAGWIIPLDRKVPKVPGDTFVASTVAVIVDGEIGACASIWFGCALRGDDCSIRIGSGMNLAGRHYRHGRCGGRTGAMAPGERW